MVTDSDEVWQLLVSHGKLDRDKGVARVQEEVAGQSATVTDLIQKLEAFRIDNGQEKTPWETKLGILLGSKAIVSGELTTISDSFLQCCLERCKLLLTDEEVRVRLACGELLGALVSAQGVGVYDDCKDLIMSLIRDNMERKGEVDSEGGVAGGVPGGRPHSPFGHSSDSIFHETAGWRNLETSVKCLQSVVEGCQGFTPDPELMSLVFATLDHTNRFVRETGFYTLGAIVCSSNDVCCRFADDLTARLAAGMADNWSQVRLASTTAARQFLMALPPHLPSKFGVHSKLLPCLCLNRYYLAEGVRIYSQETWKMVTAKEDGGGRQVVINHIDSVVKYYIQCTKADNHAVREAACQCIAELAAKIDSSVMAGHVDVLLDTLVDCFNDDSWPVRDMACVASGKFVLNYPQQSLRCRQRLEGLFFENLFDSIPSVRQGGALSIANLVRAYGLTDDILIKMNERLDSVKHQPASSGGTGGGDVDSTQSLGQFGVAKRFRDNDFALHEDQVMYSCGSLAPKMSRGSGGCSDCKFQRVSELWEKADGAIYLIGELSALEECRPKLTTSILKAAEACRRHHYVSHFSLIETMLKTLPSLADNLGKRAFKGQFLEEFLDCLFYALDSREHALASAAATHCLAFLSDFVGPNILRGRVEQYNPRYLSLLDGNSIPFTTAAMPARPLVAPPSTLPIPMDTKERRPSLGGTPTNSPRQ